MSKPRILFVCIGNACRSQMAEGFARAKYGKRYEIWSAGSRPAGFVAPLSLTVMQEKSIDISKHTSKSTKQVPQGKYEAVVTMGCGDDACPHLPALYRMDWQIEDPYGKPIEAFRAARDRIEKEVDELFAHLEKLSKTGHP